MRHQDWELRFEAFLLSRRNAPFVWGKNDCAIFAADCFQALTGIDPVPPSWRKHTTEKQALRTLQRNGGMVSVATAAFGQPVPVLTAQVGDVLLVKMGRRDALAICNGQTAYGPGANGLVSVGVETASMCWRVA